jgi:hypothetical protein
MVRISNSTQKDCGILVTTRGKLRRPADSQESHQKNNLDESKQYQTLDGPGPTSLQGPFY